MCVCVCVAPRPLPTPLARTTPATSTCTSLSASSGPPRIRAAPTIFRAPSPCCAGVVASLGAQRHRFCDAGGFGEAEQGRTNKGTILFPQSGSPHLLQEAYPSDLGELRSSPNIANMFSNNCPKVVVGLQIRPEFSRLWPILMCVYMCAGIGALGLQARSHAWLNIRRRYMGTARSAMG